MKTITNKKDLLAAAKSSLSIVADIVGTTLGPGGKTVLIEQHGQGLDGEPLAPRQTKDGATVIKNVAMQDEVLDVVAQAVKEISTKTNQEAGDGTTTAIVLGNAFFEHALTEVETANTNPQKIQREITALAESVDEKLQEMAIPVKDFDKIEHVATISANGDREMGSLIRQAFEAVGAEGVVIVDEGAGAKHSLEIVTGYQFKRGAEGYDRFFNNNARTKFEAENVHVVLYNGKLMNVADVLHALNTIHRACAEAEPPQGMPPVLFLANEFSQEVITFLLINRAEAGLSVCAVRAPHQTTVTTAVMDDLGYFLGGCRLGDGTRSLSNLTFDDVGVAKKVTVDRYTTTLFDGMGDEADLLERIDQLKGQKKLSDNAYDAATLADRIAALSEGVAKIGVGANTELEMKEKYHRMEDAVNAARAAMEQGVVPGGGATLYRLSLTFPFARKSSPGERIFALALQAPLFQIMDNLGLTLDEKKSIAERLAQGQNLVYDGVSGEIVDALEAGIIDPVKVTRTALKNATSIAGLLTTSGGAITFTRKK